jgi:N-acetylglutamate synthase-like GNAT family acetyltransferase
MIFTITEEDPNQPDAILLMNELSDVLESITGDSGKTHFKIKDVTMPRSLFVVARNQQRQAVGCGALRPLDEQTGEIKRMYVKIQNTGIGTRILAYLEMRAKELKYQVICLETRLVNQRAVRFYENNGYHRIQNYSHYIGRPESVCFEKRIVSSEDKKKSIV